MADLPHSSWSANGCYQEYGIVAADTSTAVNMELDRTYLDHIEIYVTNSITDENPNKMSWIDENAYSILIVSQMKIETRSLE